VSASSDENELLGARLGFVVRRHRYEPTSREERSPPKRSSLERRSYIQVMPVTATM
jgi:hypothetical protein